MKVATQLCEDRPNFSFLNMLNDLYVNDSMFNAIFKIAPEFKETIVMCKLFDTWTDCNELLFPILTKKGLCYSFNALSLQKSLSNE